MTTPQLQFPLVFCATVPRCAPTDIPLPFGLPEIDLPDPCCLGLDISLQALAKLIAPLYPFLKLIGCATELMQIVLAIPDAIGPPPSPSKIVQLVQHVEDFIENCVPYIISLTPIGIVFELACMLGAICQFIANLLACLETVVTINLGISLDASFCAESTDVGLQTMAVCLDAQGANLSAALIDKLGGLLNIFSLISLVIQILIDAVPGLGQALQKAMPSLFVNGKFCLQLGFSLTAGAMIDIAPLQALVIIFQDLAAVLIIFCGGQSTYVAPC